MANGNQLTNCWPRARPPSLLNLRWRWRIRVDSASSWAWLPGPWPMASLMRLSRGRAGILPCPAATSPRHRESGAEERRRRQEKPNLAHRLLVGKTIREAEAEAANATLMMKPLLSPTLIPTLRKTPLSPTRKRRTPPAYSGSPWNKLCAIPSAIATRSTSAVR